MADSERKQVAPNEKSSKLPDYFEDPEGFLVSAFKYIESAISPRRLVVPLSAVSNYAYKCKQAGRTQEEASLLALKTEAFLKAAQLRADGNPFIKICSYTYWDVDKKRVRQSIIFAISMPQGHYFSAEAPREKLGPELTPYLEEFDQKPYGVPRRKIDGYEYKPQK